MQLLLLGFDFFAGVIDVVFIFIVEFVAIGKGGVVVVAVVFAVAVVVVVSDEAVFNVVSETKRVFQLMKLKE